MTKLPQNVLIIEDEAITQRYLKDILGQYNLNSVECYDNAQDALAHMKTRNYDMILMDINIKGSMDGIQLAREILRTRTIPIIFITAHSDNETFQEVLELSPYGFIAKPFSSQDVEVALQLAHKRFLAHKEKIQTVHVEETVESIEITEHYTYSKTEKILYFDDNPVKLNAKQTILIEMLSSNLNNSVDYDSLTMAIWENDYIADSALRTLVYSVRKLLPDLPISSHSKVGYSLNREVN
ncbi:MAG TPA: response regulator transcription factor [Sulfurovum sp.]|nr:response regulator transcription factor [Sulfurovum sp.]